MSKSELRIFLLLSVLYPEAGMEHIYAGFGDAPTPRRRAGARTRSSCSTTCSTGG